MAGLRDRLQRLARQRAAVEPMAAEPLELVDLATLEIVEVDAEGRLNAAPGRVVDIRELGYAPRDRDPTGLAGLWEALA
jgi:hypothetical protein